MENDSKHEARKKLIDDICNMEWEMFDKVQNKGGRASCQNDEAFLQKNAGVSSSGTGTTKCF